MRSKFVAIPRLITPGRPVEIDGMPADLQHIKGVFYSDNIRAMMRVLSSNGVAFSLAGSPSKGIRAIAGQGFEIIDPYKAWLFDTASVSIDEIYETLQGFYAILGDMMHVTAAKTFGKLVGRLPWIDDNIKKFARIAYTGGIQWSRPGVYLHTITSDMHEAYYWAMHKEPLPKRWKVTYSKQVPPTMMSLVHATIKTNGRNPLPILPRNIGAFRTHLVVGQPQTITGYWYGPDFHAARRFASSIDIHWTAFAEPTYILAHRLSMDSYPKALRKRLALVGYGIHAQAEVKYEGVFCSTFYEACNHFGTHRIRSTMYDMEDGRSVWWMGEQDTRPYVRVDWGGLVTARVRHAVLREGHRIMEAGGEVARIYVDSLTANRKLIGGYGSAPGTFKIEAKGPSIIGPPGVGLIAGKLKRSGLEIDRAMKIIDQIRNGTWDDRNPDTNWTGLTEEIPT